MYHRARKLKINICQNRLPSCSLASIDTHQRHDGDTFHTKALSFLDDTSSFVQRVLLLVRHSLTIHGCFGEVDLNHGPRHIAITLAFFQHSFQHEGEHRVKTFTLCTKSVHPLCKCTIVNSAAIQAVVVG